MNDLYNILYTIINSRNLYAEFVLPALSEDEGTTSEDSKEKSTVFGVSVDILFPKQNLYIPSTCALKTNFPEDSFSPEWISLSFGSKIYKEYKN